MDLCARAKIKDITVYCNCSAATSEILEEDDYNFRNYKELYFKPSSDKKIEAFWKYLNYQNVPLPPVGEPKSHKKHKRQKHAKFVEKLDQKQVKFDEKLKQDAEFKTTNWAGKLAYLQSKGYDKILTQKKSCNICKNDDFDATFADVNCRQIVSGLPALPKPKKVEIITEINEHIHATKRIPQTNKLASKTSNKLSQMSKIHQPVSTIFASKTSISNEYCDIPNVSRINPHYRATAQNKSKIGTSIVQINKSVKFDGKHVGSKTEVKTHRPQRIKFHSMQDMRHIAHINKSTRSLTQIDAPAPCASSMSTSFKK